MTELEPGKVVTRLIGTSVIRGRQLIARMTAEGMLVKLEKERWSSAYFVPWKAVYDVGGKMKAQTIRAERARKRKERRGL